VAHPVIVPVMVIVHVPLPEYVCVLFAKVFAETKPSPQSIVPV